MLRIKRIYDEPTKTDGARILVDRLWPRGVSKASAQLELWLKEIAPSPELRTWFDHKPERFEAFSKRYEAELAANPAVAELKQIMANHPTVTLLYGAKSPTTNHAVVLQKFLSST
ncbi:MAG TPA: DUF488 domain-containing protein [Candidatus Saccharimonadales bacterium]|nr:DUF488 domain-containing protein [Candidatus Saccharimonadales bacterium]